MRTTAPGESALLLLDAVELLNREAISYAVIGALAASVHGAVRGSMDADVLLSVPVQRLRELEALCRSHGFKVEVSRGDVDDPITAMLKLTDLHGNRVDMLIGLRGLDPEAFARTLNVPFLGQTLSFIGPEDFIAMKVFAGGPRDIDDAARTLLATASSLDLGLLRRLTKKFGSAASATLEKLLKERK